MIFKILCFVMRKQAFCKCENKDADQLRSNCAADQRLCFRYTDSRIPLLPRSEISSLWPSSVAVSLVCVGPGRTPRRPVYSQRGLYMLCHGKTCLPEISDREKVLIRLHRCTDIKLGVFVVRKGIKQLIYLMTII